jgi:catechol 2,3-dioxygenase-like lactoylglutathione lyase family enzyme
MSPRKLRLIHGPTPDWEAMRRFYGEILCLEEAGGWDLPGDRGAFLSAGAGELELMEADPVALEVLPEPGAWHLALEVEDLDAMLARVRAAGAPVVRKVVIQPWGVRDCVVRDPAGNPVLLYEQPG